MWSTNYSCKIVIKLEFSQQIFEKYSSIKFHENSSSGSKDVPCGQKDGRTDTHDEANSHFSQFCECASKALCDIHTKVSPKLNKTFIVSWWSGCYLKKIAFLITCSPIYLSVPHPSIILSSEEHKYEISYYRVSCSLPPLPPSQIYHPQHPVLKCSQHSCLFLS
jgi:hypothetical protein